ncbi:MAG: NTP transferase domain-containing protein [Dermatophilaceae bacterium]
MTAPAALGILLAAGAGSRMGEPKALVIGEDGRPWLHSTVDALRDGGCDHVIVVLGAASERAVSLLGGMAVTVAVAADWAEGMSASLRSGLIAADRHARTHPQHFGVVVISLVDLPDVDQRVVARVLSSVGTDPSALGRAVYDGTPGHPVVIGVDHLPDVLKSTSGDHGARDYLRERELTLVECADLASGRDVDFRRP